MSTPLSYALGPSTRLDLDAHAIHLVLRYPLKTIRLHGAWRGVFEYLQDGCPHPLSNLARTMPEVPLQKIIEFLDQLVYKGFLARSGVILPDPWPWVSIIIPVRNRPREITACLDAIEQLDYPAEKVEIIVVDDASTDETPDTVARYPVRLIRLEKHKQASHCRNLGARQAAGDILAFIDSDCTADAQWLKKLVPAFGDPKVAAVGGRVDGYFTEKRLDRYEKAKSSLMVSSRAKRSEADDPFFYVPACNFLVRKAVFLSINGFKAELTVGEDVDFCWRLQKQGHGLEFRPEGTVFHKHRNDLIAFCRRRFDYGTSEPLLQKIHPEKVKQFVVPPAAAGFWGLVMLVMFTGQWVLLAAAILVLLIDSALKWHKFRSRHIGLGLVIVATARSSAAFFYHVCAFISRYYLIVGLLCLPFAPIVGVVVLSMHLLCAAVERRLKKADLSMAGFAFLFTAEQLAYQAGVWWGCIAHRVLTPLIPRLVWPHAK